MGQFTIIVQQMSLKWHPNQLCDEFESKKKEDETFHLDCIQNERNKKAK